VHWRVLVSAAMKLGEFYMLSNIYLTIKASLVALSMPCDRVGEYLELEDMFISVAQCEELRSS
jgi:hypothetical protein